MSVKFFYALRQQPHLNTEEFQRIWRDEYGPLVASLQTKLKIAKYTQIHRFQGTVDTQMRESRTLLWKRDEAPFDVVDEYLLDMSMDEFVAQFSELRDAWKPLVEFERRHVDAAGSHLSFVTERPQVVPGANDNLLASPWNHVLRIHVFAEMRDDDGAAFDHWANEHAAVVRRWAHASGAEKYVQNHPRVNTRNAAVLDAMRADRGLPVPLADNRHAYTWYASCWVHDDIMTKGAGNPTSLRAAGEIAGDEDLGWMLPGSMNYMVGKDYIFVDKYRI